MGNANSFFRAMRNSAMKRVPEILMGVGIAGMISTTVLAVAATPKALELLKDAKYEKSEANETETELTVIETVRVAWTPYIPAMITCGLSLACLICANTKYAKRTTALVTAYKLSESAFSDYKEKVVETIGDKKEKNIREKVDKKHIEQKPVSKSTVIFTEKGNTLFFDVLSGQYFRSDIETVRKTENLLNKRMLDDMYVSLNDLYEELGLEKTDIGSELGWNVSDELINIKFSSQITDDGQPCIVINYGTKPKYRYDKFA